MKHAGHSLRRMSVVHARARSVPQQIIHLGELRRSHGIPSVHTRCLLLRWPCFSHRLHSLSALCSLLSRAQVTGAVENVLTEAALGRRVGKQQAAASFLLSTLKECLWYKCVFGYVHIRVIYAAWARAFAWVLAGRGAERVKQKSSGNQPNQKRLQKSHVLWLFLYPTK